MSRLPYHDALQISFPLASVSSVSKTPYKVLISTLLNIFDHSLGSIKWNLENIKDRYLRQIFLFEFGGNNAIEVHVTSGKQIFP